MVKQMEKDGSHMSCLRTTRTNSRLVSELCVLLSLRLDTNAIRSYRLIIPAVRTFRCSHHILPHLPERSRGKLCVNYFYALTRNKYLQNRCRAPVENPVIFRHETFRPYSCCRHALLVQCSLLNADNLL